MIGRHLGPSVIFLLVVFVAFDPLIYQGQTKQDSREKELDTERKKLAKEKDPADRAESLMKIADITLTYLRDSATANDAGQVESYTQLYWETVSQARNEMMLSGLNPYKKPKGYQAVETGVRRQTRVLQEIARSLNLQARKPVEAAIEGVSKVRDEMLKALFK